MRRDNKRSSSEVPRASLSHAKRRSLSVSLSRAPRSSVLIRTRASRVLNCALSASWKTHPLGNAHVIQRTVNERERETGVRARAYDHAHARASYTTHTGRVQDKRYTVAYVDSYGEYECMSVRVRVYVSYAVLRVRACAHADART